MINSLARHAIPCFALLTLTWLTFPAKSMQLEPGCDRLKAFSPVQQARILARNDRLDAACTAFLLEHLGHQRFHAAIPVIVTYMDFEWVPKSTEEATILLHPSLPLLHGFPGATALVEFEEAAAPAIVEFLASPRGSPLARLNGSIVLLLIYIAKPEEAVRKLVRASLATTDHVAAERLRKAAVVAADQCPALHLDTKACQAALLER